MPRDARFWRNVGIVGLLHVVVLLGLAAWSGSVKKPAQPRILWMDGAAALAAMNVAQVSSAVPPRPKPEATATPEEIAPGETSPPTPEVTPPPVAPQSEIPMATPAPTETPSATPKSTPRSTPTPPEKPSPKPKTKPKPSVEPVSKKKKPRAKPSPAPTVKPKKSPVKKEKEKETKKVSVESTASPKDAGREKNEGKAKTNSKKPGGSGASGSGQGDSARFNWYAGMLHDRFFSAWEQPTSVVATGVRMSALVRIRIEQDGRVSSFEIVKRSGNVVVDESVAAVAKRVTRVDPLPAGLSPIGPYEVTINFELNSKP